MARTLIVVYSNTGTSRRLAALLSSQLGWPVGDIVEARSRAGTGGMLRCVADSLLRRRPAIAYQGPDPAGFDAVVLVAPIWVGQLAGPMRSFVTERRQTLPRAAVISVMGGKGGENAFAEVGHLLGKPPLLAAAFSAREIDDGSAAGRLQAFGSAFQAMQQDGAPPVRLADWSPRIV